MAVDYRELNKIIEDFAGSVPGMKSLFPFMANRKYYAKMDNLWGYHQLKVVEEDQHLLAIITPFGLYKWTRLPFGLWTATGVYQDRMANVILKDYMYDFALVYIDDTGVFGNTASEFLHNLRLVFERFVQYNVRLKPEKCSFGFEEINFVGHVFDVNGYHLSDERKQGIQDLKVPNSLKQLRSFLGMVNYFRDFIPHLSTELVPLTALTTKDTPFVWTPTHDLCFNRIKDLIWSTSRLHHLNDIGDITLYTDASSMGMGAVLVQKGINSMPEKNDLVDHPILYLSQKFSPAAQKWSTIEQECYAVFYFIISLQSYLLGRHFFVATDHRNLMYLEKSIVPKIVRWRLRLLEFKFTIIHIPGVTNLIADPLSRLLKISVVEPKNNNNCVYIPNVLLNRMVLVNGVEVDNYQIFNDFHNDTIGHHGLQQTCKLIHRAKKSWIGYYTDIHTMILNCPVCQKVKAQPIPNIILNKYHIHGESPMTDLSVDSIGPLPEDENHNKFILVIIDNFSKFVQLYATTSTTAQSYIQAILQHMSIFGVMSSIRSDGGTQFTANICNRLADTLGFTHHIILAYHPQANGIVERKNAEIMKHLRALILVKQDRDKWSMYLPLIQRILNSTLDIQTGICPAELIFGSQLPIMAPLMADANHVESPSLSDYVAQISEAMKILVSRSSQYLNKKKSLPIEIESTEGHQFEIGDYVLITYPTRPPHKLSPIYRGPLEIVSKVRDDIFTLRDLISGKQMDFHVDRLRIFRNSTFPNEKLSPVALAAADKDEFIVESIIDHRGSSKSKSNSKLEFRIRWLGYHESEDTWLPWREVKDLKALDDYAKSVPELKIF
jgi:hypothetical protein